MNAPKDKVTATLLATLKRHNPSKVRAFAGDDDMREIAVPTRRRRWSQVIEAIDARAWSRVELCDKAGAVLGYVDNAEPARDVEDLTPTTGNGGQLLLAERIVKMVISAQRDAMTFRDAELSALLKAQGDVVREMAASVGHLGRMYREQVQAAEETSAIRAAGVVAPEGDWRQLLDALPTLVQVLPLLRGMLGAGTTPAAPSVSNGVKGS